MSDNKLNDISTEKSVSLFEEQQKCVSSEEPIPSAEFSTLPGPSVDPASSISTELVVVDLVMNDTSFFSASKDPSLSDMKIKGT